jgi:hypothetical protein
MGWSWRVPKGHHFRVFLHENAAFFCFYGRRMQPSRLLPAKQLSSLPACLMSVTGWTQNCPGLYKHASRNVHDCCRRKIKQHIDTTADDITYKKLQHNKMQPLLTQYNEVHNLTYQFEVQITHQVDGRNQHLDNYTNRQQL